MTKYYVTINGLPLIRRRYGSGYDTGTRRDLGVAFPTRKAAMDAALSLFPNAFYGDPAAAIRLHSGPDSNRPDSIRYAGL